MSKHRGVSTYSVCTMGELQIVGSGIALIEPCAHVEAVLLLHGCTI